MKIVVAPRLRRQELDATVIDPDEDGYGELAVRGDNVFLGYYNDEEATKKAFNEDGYFLTGDIGCIRNNKVYVRGRKDTMIPLPNGENIASKVIEKRVLELDESVIKARICVRDEKLSADLYIDDDALLKDSAFWEKKMDELNSAVSRYERILQYSLFSSRDYNVGGGKNG